MTETPALTLHQTLHGYKDGHRLLASSLDLGPEAAREMLLLSDAAGAGAPPGFESFICAYPLTKDHLYAFARTWPAPDVRRSGCVWTHTLLLNFADLARLDTWEQISLLEGSWTRPSTSDKQGTLNLNFYANPLAIHLDTGSFRRPFIPPDTPFLNSLLQALYGGDEENKPSSGTGAPVFLAAHNSQQWQDLAWRIWLQLWPRMRRQFAFCTGTTTARRVGGRAFDLQIAPSSAHSTLRRDAPNALFLGFGTPRTPSNQGANQAQEWLSLMSEDLQVPIASLQRFLRVFGAEGDLERGDVRRLGDVYAALQAVKEQETPVQVELLLETLARHYPRPNQGKKQKIAFFGPSSDWLPLGEAKCLEAQATTSFWKMLPVMSLELEGRAARLWATSRSEAETLFQRLVQPGANPLAEKELRGFAQAFTEEDAARVLGINWTLAGLVVREHPDLATSPTLWHGSYDLRHELLDVLLEASLSAEQRQQLGAALFEAKADDVIEEAVRRFGASVTRGAFFAWALAPLATDQPVIPLVWRTLFGGHEEMMVAWLRHHTFEEPDVGRAAALLSLLSPDSPSVRVLPIGLWLDLARTARSYLVGRHRAEVLAFVLALGLGNLEDRGHELVESTFEDVHEAQLRNILGYVAWQWLEPHVPNLEQSNWDKCERLRRAVIEAFARNNWPEAALLRTIKRHETFSATLRSGGHTAGGKAYLKHLRRSVKAGELAAVPWQTEILLDKKGWRELWESLFE